MSAHRNLHDYDDNEICQGAEIEYRDSDFEEMDDLVTRKRLKRKLDERLERKRLREELEDYDGELDDFDWGPLDRLDR